MSRAGVPEEVIVTHVQNHGMVAPLRAGDLIALQQQGVAPRVVQAMQAPPAPAAGAYPPGAMVPAYAVPAPVYYAPPPYWYPPPCYYPRHRFSWGVSVAR